MVISNWPFLCQVVSEWVGVVDEDLCIPESVEVDFAEKLSTGRARFAKDASGVVVIKAFVKDETEGLAIELDVFVLKVSLDGTPDGT